MRLVALSLLLALPALASRPTLENRDARDYAYDLDCGAFSKQRKVAPNATAPLDASCRLKVKGAGSAKVHAGSRCVIERASLACL